MGIIFDGVFACLGFSTPSGAGAVWGEWPVAVDLLSLTGLFAGTAQKRALTFCPPLLPPAHVRHQKFPTLFSGYKVVLCAVTELNSERRPAINQEVSGVRAGNLRMSI